MPQADPRLSVIERVDAVCDRFEAEWRAGRRPSVDAYVAAAPEADREALRSALLAVDAELRAETPASDTSVSTESVGPERTGPTVVYVEDGSVVPNRIGRFEVRAVLGSGAFGRVYRAYDPALDREVAVKVPLADAIRGTDDRERFIKEAKAAATISHPNICQIHEVGEHEGQPYIVMALVPGQSLADVVRSRKEPMAEKQAAIIVRKLALALEAAHRRGVVHRDLKPANIMFDRDRKDLVVMDFGLARRPVAGSERDTRSGVVMGTPAYMSPEQARGAARDVGPAADIFSLGVILYELLTGSRPFTGTAYEVISQILLLEPQPPSQRRPGIDPVLEAACLKALAKDPARRFASMKEFAAALDVYLRRPTGPAAETTRAVETTPDRDASGTSSARKLEEVFEVLAEQQKAAQAETKAAVEAAAAKARTPRWIFAGLAVLIVGGLTAIAGIVFFIRGDKVTVQIHLPNIDITDRTLSFFLDEEPISAEKLAKPIELTPGEHWLVVKRGKVPLNRLRLTVTGGRSPGVVVEPIDVPLPPTPPTDADRAAAEWVLRVGGTVAAADPAHLPATAEAAMGLPPIKAREQLPPTPFKLVGVNFGGYEGKLDESNEAGLAALNGLEHLQALNLTYSRVTDRGLNVLRDLPSLRHLLLHGTRVTDAVMKEVGRFRMLESLSLNLTRISDEGLAELTALDNLRDLALLQTRVGDRGLKVVGQFKKLERLNLGATQITDTGLAELAGLIELNELAVSGPQFTGTGLKHLPGLPKLAILQLGPGLTDAGLAAAAGLPRVTRLHLTRTPDVTDAGLKHLAGMTQLELLKLLSKGVTDDGLAHLAKLDRLWDLTLADTSVTDLGLKHLGPLWRLKNLDLTRTAVTGTGLKELTKLTQLGSLDLSGCPITDVGLPEVNKLNSLGRLVLAQTKVTDAGLPALKNLAALREINLTGCPVTNEGLFRLQRNLPGCKITPAPKDANRAVPE